MAMPKQSPGLLRDWRWWGLCIVLCLGLIGCATVGLPAADYGRENVRIRTDQVPDAQRWKRATTQYGLGEIQPLIPSFDGQGKLMASWTPSALPQAPTYVIAHGGGGIGGMMMGGRGGPPGGGGDRVGGGGGPGGGRSGRTANPESDSLRQAIMDKLPDAEIKSRLTRLRESRKNNEEKLARAQEELRAVLSVRQEAIAVMAGLLP